MYAGALCLASLMGLIVVDVVLRNLFSVVVPGGMELTGLLTIVVVLCAASVVELEGDHIRVDLVVGRLPAYAAAATNAGGLLLAMGIMLLTATQFYAQAAYRHANGLVTGVLGLPEWPAAAAAMVFVVLFALALLARLLVALAAVVRSRDLRAAAVFVAWVALTAWLASLCLRSEAPPLEWSRDLQSIAAIALCFVLIFLGVHVAAAMAVTAVVGISLLISPAASLASIGTTAIGIVSDPTWSVVPLFTWMGLIVVTTGLAADLYRAAYRWIGHLPGGLASASTVACAGLSSIVGDTLSGVYSMGSIALPEMRAYRYDMKLATATVACAATIGVMIPPSLAFIVYGMITEVSIGKLFLAGIVPGILFAVILIALITVRATLNPALAPRGERSSWRQRFESLAGTWQVMLLVLLVLGGIYAGIVTPNEAAGLGVAGALLVSLVTGRLSLAGLRESMSRTLRLTAGIIVIFMFAAAFSRFIAVSGLTQQLSQVVIGLDLGPYQTIAAILVFYVVIGMFMNALPALVLTVPLFFPIAVNAGFDPVWFGVLVVIMVELGVVTPPIGVNVFAISTIAKDVPMVDIFRGVLPFWLAYFVLVLLIIVFPQICLWLPSLM